MKKNETNATQAIAAGARPVSIFNNPEFGSVRIITREDGEPLFCLRDVAACLGYKDTSDAIKTRCDEGSVIYLPLETAGGTQQVKFGPESEVYRLIFGSKLDSAKKFQDWVFKEVLPSIRKTGPSEITSCISKDSVSEITVVNFLGRDIHVLGTPEDPLFIAKDVAAWIDLSNVSVMCRVLEEDDIRKVYIISAYGSNGAKQTKEVLVITEQGLYKILWRSNKPEAQKFASKCADIIKEIRLKGSYSVQKTPQTYIEALKETLRLAEENERLALENKKQAKEVTKLNSKIENDAPKVEMYNDLINSHDCISTTELAKIYKMSTMKFNAEMRAHGLYRALDNLPLQKSINAGLFIVKEIPYTDKSGKKRINPKVYVTPKGQELIHNMFKAWEEYSGLFGD